MSVECVDGERGGVCECEGECDDVRRVVDVEGMSVEVEGEAEVPLRRKEVGGVAPDPVSRWRRERYGLLLPPFPLTLMLLVLPFTPKYWISPVCDGISDVRETSLGICGRTGRLDVLLEKMDALSVVAVNVVVVV